MRSPLELEDVPRHKWTEEEYFAHLMTTFFEASRMFVDVMERYVTYHGQTEDRDEQIEIMRAGLRETVKDRHPGGKKEKSA